MDVSILEKYLPQDLWEIAQEYSIPAAYVEKMPLMMEMILRSRSIDTHEEKQNRFNLLPLMNDSQIAKLQAILDKEKAKLAEIEQKYTQKKQEIKKKYLSKWQEMGYVKKMDDLHQQESTIQEQEEEEAEALLDSI